MVHYMCPGLRYKTCKLQVTGTKVKTRITGREVPGTGFRVRNEGGTDVEWLLLSDLRPWRVRGAGVRGDA